MKNLHYITAIILFLLPILLSAQELKDVVYLKNGSIIKGRIIEQTPGVNLKIRTADGSQFVYPFSDVEKISTETLAPPAVTYHSPQRDSADPKEYKYQLGLGIALGGGGIIGVPVRIGLSRKAILEVGASIRPMYISTETTYSNSYGYSHTETEEEFIFPAMIAGGLELYFGESYKWYAGKIIRNGIAFKFGHTITDKIGESMFALAWTRERFKQQNKKNSYVMNLGAGILQYDREMDYLGITETDIIPMIYWKFHWNWGLF